MESNIKSYWKNNSMLPSLSIEKIKEYISLLGLNLLVKLKNLIEFKKVFYKYYRNLNFAKVDISIFLMYLFDNPFSISKRFIQHHSHSEEYTYGETPLTTFADIAKEAKITSCDTVYELGCGRGRVSFWLKCFTGCKVVAVDIVPEFISHAKRIQRKLKVDQIEFINENFLETNFGEANVVYLYGTCLEEQSIKALIEKFRALKPGTRIITVSYALNDFNDDKVFETMKHFTSKFTWGEGEVYIQMKK